MDSIPDEWKPLCRYWGSDMNAIMEHLAIFATTVDKNLLTTSARMFTNVDVMTRRFLYLLVRSPKDGRVAVVKHIEVFYTRAMAGVIQPLRPVYKLTHRHFIWIAAAMNGLSKLYNKAALRKKLAAMPLNAMFNSAYFDLMPTLLNVRWMVAKHYGTDQIFIEPHEYDDDYNDLRRVRDLMSHIESLEPEAKRQKKEQEQELVTHSSYSEASSTDPSIGSDSTEQEEEEAPAAMFGIEELEFADLDLGTLDLDFEQFLPSLDEAAPLLL